MSLALCCRILTIVLLALASSGLSASAATRTVSLSPSTVVSRPSPFARCAIGDRSRSPVAAPGFAPYSNSAIEPYLAVDPRTVHTAHPTLLGVWQQDRFPLIGAQGLVSATSVDGGHSWTEHPIPFTRCAPHGLPFPAASYPWVSFGPDGTAYAAALVGHPSVPDWGIAVSVSHDDGRFWEHTQTIMRDHCCDFSDKESITADPDNPGVAYLVWSREQGASEPTWFARTTNGGQTWSTPRPILHGRDLLSTANQILIDPRTDTLDDILSIATDPSSHRPKCQMGQITRLCPLGPEYVGQVSLHWSIVLLRSHDGGQTWSAPTIIARDRAVGVPAQSQRIRTAAEIPSVAIDPASGRLIVVWQDGRFCHGAYDQIAITSSPDGGNHWTTPTRVNRDTSWPAFTPAVAIDGQGVIGVSFYRIRRLPLTKPGLPTDDWFTWSSDGGQHFAPDIHLAGPFDLLAAPDSEGPYLGAYQGVAVIGNSFVSLFVQSIRRQPQIGTAVVTRTIVPFAGTLGAATKPASPGVLDGMIAGAISYVYCLLRRSFCRLLCRFFLGSAPG